MTKETSKSADGITLHVHEITNDFVRDARSALLEAVYGLENDGDEVGIDRGSSIHLACRDYALRLNWELGEKQTRGYNQSYFQALVEGRVTEEQFRMKSAHERNLMELVVVNARMSERMEILDGYKETCKVLDGWVQNVGGRQTNEVNIIHVLESWTKAAVEKNGK